MNNLVAIGVDGGGTKTKTCCVSISSKTIFETYTTDATNWNSVGEEVAKDALFKSIDEALKNANSIGSKKEVATIILSMAGVDRPDDKKKVIGWINEQIVNGKFPYLKESDIHVHSDAVAALASGTDGILHGIVVISGTGMIAYGFDKIAKKEKRAGGWGPLLGDEGSGYQIGYDVLKAIVSAYDGRGEQTILWDKLKEKLNQDNQNQEDGEKIVITDQTQLIPWAYNEANRKWSTFADLSKLAYECANQNDKVAIQIIDHAAQQLLETISAVVRGLNFEDKEFPMVLAGGNIDDKDKILAKKLVEKLEKKYPKIKISFPNPNIPAQVAAALLGVNNYNSTQ